LEIFKSELIRESIIEYLYTLKQPNAWGIGEDLFGNLSSDRKESVKSKVKSRRI